MKQLVIVFLLLIISVPLFSQRKTDIGLIGGTGYYMGDINPSRLLYSPGYHVGPIIRYNFNTHYSLRFKVVYASLSGSDSDFDNVVTQRPYPASFNNKLLNISAQAEYNFFEYTSGVVAGDWTPYIFGGAGYSLMLATSLVNNTVAPKMHLTMPFGIGAKINLTRRLSAGAEWSYNKTFNDRFDGVTSPISPSKETKLYNNDWYSFLGLFITYKFFNFAADCPVYD